MRKQKMEQEEAVESFFFKSENNKAYGLKESWGKGAMSRIRSVDR